MACRLVLSFFLAFALYFSDVFAGPCRPKLVSSYAVSSVATSGASTDLASLTSFFERLTVEISASASTDILTGGGETGATQATDSLSPSLPTSLVTTATTDGETTATATDSALDTPSFTTGSVADDSFSITNGLGTDISSSTSGSVATGPASYTTSGATVDTTNAAITKVSDPITGSTTTNAPIDATSNTTADVCSLTTDSAASTYTISDSETGTTTGPVTTTSAGYCVCATAIEPVTTVAATRSPETTETEIIVVTDKLADETKILVDAPSTDVIAGPDRTVTAVRHDGSIEIIEPKTIYDTIARTTIELPTAYKTVYTTDDEIRRHYQHTTEITTSTSTGVVTETITSIESIPTTSTEYVVTGTTIKFAPGMKIHVTNSRTFVVYSAPSIWTHVLYTTTDYITSAWTTAIVHSTDTDYVTIPTENVEITTATNTVDETIIMSTDTGFTVSTVTTNEWATETSVSTSTSTKLLPPKYTQHEFPWLQNKKRAIASTTLKARAALPDSLEDQWISQFGESHFHSACSCFLSSSLPTRTVHMSAEPETIIEKSTIINKIYGDTVTLTVTTAAAVTTQKTVTEMTIVDGTTSIEMRTVHEDVTQTILSTPTAQSLITRVMINDDVKQVTKEIAVIDTITLYGIATGYTWMEVTQTQDIYDLRSKLFPVVQTIDIAETSTSTLPTTTVKTTLDVTSTALSTADETVYDAFTSIVPVAVTDVKKFTYTKTIFTDATSVYSIEATNTIGTIATTTLTTLTTVANGVTSTITTILSSDVTVTAQAIATETCAMPIKDGDFEYAPGNSPWYKSFRSKYDWNKKWLDDTHGKVLQTERLYNNTNFILWQDIKSCKGVTFSCDYQFWINKYYYVKGGKIPGKGKNDNSDSAFYWWTPYVWTFWNDNSATIGERWPRDSSETGRWMGANIKFQTTGNVDMLWVYPASPQWPWEGDNFLMLDNYKCKPIAFKGPNGPVGVPCKRL
ncbi:hypothetical protein FPSE_00617 [Fusarium pseudograminearum CS3096]|uniref:Uncharacterized protein n=1 Tax=Fusarium pseudograminearum (strain CS3096) TaxID=1028729 RepID=K3V273_FUSPC|nr:hypothetical protein FPSE_00617 [Fusarium pseudograminearum CS3096]EKJ79306.1 hypothetical protein FPSE_00617 [Fusarium pseudograminearum CS3096]